MSSFSRSFKSSSYLSPCRRPPMPGRTFSNSSDRSITSDDGADRAASGQSTPTQAYQTRRYGPPAHQPGAAAAGPSTDLASAGRGECSYFHSIIDSFLFLVFRKFRFHWRATVHCSNFHPHRPETFQRPVVRGSRYRAPPALEQPRLCWPPLPWISEAFWAQDGKASGMMVGQANYVVPLAIVVTPVPAFPVWSSWGTARIAMDGVASVTRLPDLSLLTLSPLRVILFVCHEIQFSSFTFNFSHPYILDYHHRSRAWIGLLTAYPDSSASLSSSCRPIAIELPRAKKISSAPARTPPEQPLSARGDLPG